jgi:hypothetical protein
MSTDFAVPPTGPNSPHQFAPELPTTPVVDPHLLAVVRSWELLPTAIKAAIGVMITVTLEQARALEQKPTH